MRSWLPPCRLPITALTPWRFITIEGEARAKLGEVFVDALKKRDPDAEAAIEKERNRPMRSPMIVVR